MCSVPYHCPEQKSLKDFLASLKSSKAKLVVEEKVDIKTHKFKLLVKDVAPSVSVAVDAVVVDVASDQAETVVDVNRGDGDINENDGVAAEEAPAVVAVVAIKRPQLGGERCEIIIILN